MILIEDTRQQLAHHKCKNKWFQEHGITVIRSKMLVGDYTLPANQSVCVDTKKDCAELYQNLIQSHRRFRDECIKAQDCGIRLIILVENTNGITNMREIGKWDNKLQWRKYFIAKKKAEKEGRKIPKQPATPTQLIKVMHTMNKKYGVEFMFCKPSESAELIVKLLGDDANG